LLLHLCILQLFQLRGTNKLLSLWKNPKYSCCQITCFPSRVEWMVAVRNFIKTHLVLDSCLYQFGYLSFCLKMQTGKDLNLHMGVLASLVFAVSVFIIKSLMGNRTPLGFLSPDAGWCIISFFVICCKRLCRITLFALVPLSMDCFVFAVSNSVKRPSFSLVSIWFFCNVCCWSFYRKIWQASFLVASSRRIEMLWIFLVLFTQSGIKSMSLMAQ
jgi:hypothetical protein